MKSLHKGLLASVACLTLVTVASTGHAATVFDDHSGVDSYLSTPENWTNGLPSAANPGTISMDAKTGLATMTDFVVTQTGGAITQGSYPYLTFDMSGGSWTMDGGSIYCRSHTYTNGAVFTLNNGTITTNNNSTITIWGAQFIVNGGTLNPDRNVYLRGGGNFTINGGTVNQDTADAFGAPGYQGSGTMNFNSGTVTGAGTYDNGVIGPVVYENTAGRFAFQGTTTATFGGTTAGSATFVDWGTSGDRHNDDVISIDFLSGTRMSLTMRENTRALVLGGTTMTDAWAQALWDHDQLLYNGQSSTDLGGLSWADASSSSVGLGGGEYFDFTASGSFGGTLVVALLPEPATMGLLGLGGLALLRRRRH